MNFEFSYPDIVKQCRTMAYLNVISFCLLSGCGSIEMPNEQELSHIYGILKNSHSTKMPKNISFMSSLYKKSSPIYASLPESPYDFKNFRWVNKKAKKVIEPNVLAHSICCMTALIQIIRNGELQMENKEFMTYCLEINSIKQAAFLADYLKLGDFYYAGEDTGDNEYGEYRIVINTEKADLRTQFFVAEALTYLIRLLENNGPYSKDAIEKLVKCLGALPLICENVIENINDISSRDLSVICLSLSNIMTNSELLKETAFNAANAIGFELCERLEQTGDISRNIADDNCSSFATLCNCMNCIIRLYEFNPISLFENSYLKLYDRIDSYWDESIGLFLTSSKNKQKYTFKDISMVLGALRTLRSCLTEPDLYMHVEKQFSAFYSASFIHSKMFNNQFRPILQEGKLELHNLGSSLKNTAPVFADYFEVKTKKKKYYSDPDVFEAEGILQGCKNLLY